MSGVVPPAGSTPDPLPTPAADPGVAGPATTRGNAGAVAVAAPAPAYAPPHTTRGAPAGAGVGPSTTRGGGAGAAPPAPAARRRSTLVAGDQVALPSGGALVVESFITASGEAELYRAAQAPGAPVAAVPAGTPCVLKLYHHSTEPNARVMAMWAGLAVPGVLRLFGHGVLEEGHAAGRAYEIVEYAAGRSLAHRLPIRDLDRLRRLVAQVAGALHALHSHDVIHRDLKPDNLLCRDAAGHDVVLADFGIATVTGGRSLIATTVGNGTPDFMAPEQSIAFQLDGAAKSLLAGSADYYALGITILYCWLGGSPFGPGQHTAAELLAAKQHGRVPVPDDLPAGWRRLVKALLVVDPSQRLGYEGIQRWLRGETIVVPEAPTATTVDYPPLVFRTERGEDVRVAAPAQLATLLEQNPTVGKKFLYQKYVERAGWDRANPGLCAALSTITEESYPRDHATGLIAAVYALDPSRPYRADDGTVCEGFTALAAHVAAHADGYRDVLAEAGHRLWVWLKARPEPAAREGATRLAAAFADARTDPRDRTGVRVREEMHRLFVWLRALDDDRTLPFAGRTLGAPTDLLALPAEARAQAAAALADPSSLLAVWVSAVAPEHDDALARWRGAGEHTGDTLPYAFGAGPVVAGVELRGADDAVDGDPRAMAALWAAGADDVRGRVDRWLLTYRQLPLAAAAWEWLATQPAAPHLGAVVRWMLAEADDVLALLAPDAGRDAPTTADVDALVAALAAGAAADEEAHWQALRETLSGHSPVWLAPGVVVARLLVALAAGTAHGVVLPDEQAALLDGLAARLAATVEAGDALVPLGLVRLAVALRATADAVRTGAQATPGLEPWWEGLLQRAEPRLGAAYAAGWRELDGAPDDAEAAAAVLGRALLALRERVPGLGIYARWDAEERAYAPLRRLIADGAERDRVAAGAAVDRAEQETLARLRDHERRSGTLRKLADAATSERLLILVAAGLATLVVVAALSAGKDGNPILTWPGGLVALASAIGFAAVADDDGRVAAFGCGGVLGAIAIALAVVLLPITLLVLGGIVAWRYVKFRKAQTALADADAQVALPHGERSRFAAQRAAAETQLRGRERAWAAAVRRAVALAPDPAAVDPHAVRTRLLAA